MNNKITGKYQIESTVKSYETDASGKLSLSNLFNYFQEAANLHASSLDWGMEYLETIDKFWVLSRIQVLIHQMPAHKDPIMLETWSRGAEGFFAYRDFRIRKNNQDYIHAASSWLILDRKNHRPVRTDQLVKSIPGISESHLPFPQTKLQVLKAHQLIFERNVRYADIDINQHVNNGKYVEIISDALYQITEKPVEILSLDIQYMLESKLHENLAVYYEVVEPGTCIFSLVNQTQQKETCRCEVIWK